MILSQFVMKNYEYYHIKSIKHDHICINKSVIIKDPYKPNGVISYAKDHLEVFIEGKDCANIR